MISDSCGGCRRIEDGQVINVIAVSMWCFSTDDGLAVRLLQVTALDRLPVAGGQWL